MPTPEQFDPRKFLAKELRRLADRVGGSVQQTEAKEQKQLGGMWVAPLNDNEVVPEQTELVARAYPTSGFDAHVESVVFTLDPTNLNLQQAQLSEEQQQYLKEHLEHGYLLHG